jgi:hypothetical protein
LTKPKNALENSKHEREVRRLAVRLIECRHMTGDEFKLFIEGAKSKNPAAPAVKREAEEDWSKEKWR